MTSTKNRKLFLVGFLLFIALPIPFLFYKKQKLQHSFTVTTAFITDGRHLRKSGNQIFFKYEFKVGVGRYSGSTGISCDRNNRSDLVYLLVKRHLNVVYQKGDPDNCELLYDRNQYKKYGIIPPQEFVWLLDSVTKICERVE